MKSVFVSGAKQSPRARRDEGVASSPAPAAQELDPRNDVAGAGGFSPASILTRAELLDHARHPRNRGELPGADVVRTEDNPLCGDVVTMYARVTPASGQLSAVSFQGSGCIISQAAASLLTEYAVGKSVADVAALERADMESLIGGTLSPSRVKCGMLALVALKNGLDAVRS